MKVSLVSLVFSILVCLVSSEDDDCECVHPSQCLNGVATFSVQGAKINYKTSECRGIEVCCLRSPKTTGPNQPERNPKANDSPYPPTRPRMQGCGVRRLKGVSPRSPSSTSFPKIPKYFVRVSDDDPEANTDTFYGELPWLVRIYVNGEFTCGGVLISPKAVLTAAHCIIGKTSKDLEMEVGEWKAGAAVEPVAPQKQKVVHIMNHNQFNSETAEKDIAMLFVKKDFTYTAAVDYICLPDNFKEVNQNDCYAAGWGKQKMSDPEFAPILRKVAMPILNHTACERKLRTSFTPNYKLGPGFVCSGGMDNRDTCKGDGGGPLYCSMKTEPERYAAIGIISWGISCSEGYPTVSVSIPYFKRWINDGLYSWNNNILPRLD